MTYLKKTFKKFHKIMKSGRLQKVINKFIPEEVQSL